MLKNMKTNFELKFDDYVITGQLLGLVVLIATPAAVTALVAAMIYGGSLIGLIVNLSVTIGIGWLAQVVMGKEPKFPFLNIDKANASTTPSSENGTGDEGIQAEPLVATVEGANIDGLTTSLDDAESEMSGEDVDMPEIKETSLEEAEPEVKKD